MDKVEIAYSIIENGSITEEKAEQAFANLLLGLIVYSLDPDFAEEFLEDLENHYNEIQLDESVEVSQKFIDAVRADAE